METRRSGEPPSAPIARKRELLSDVRSRPTRGGGPREEWRAYIGELRRSMVLWNVDSWDWGDTVPESISQRVIEPVEKAGRGILLFHDVHKQTAAALPLILKELRLRGYRFANLDGGTPGPPRPVTSLDDGRSEPAASASGEGRAKPYRESWALIVGINEYEEWPALRYAVNDARAVVSLLRRSFGFREENVIRWIDAEATRDRIAEQMTSISNPVPLNPHRFSLVRSRTLAIPPGRPHAGDGKEVRSPARCETRRRGPRAGRAVWATPRCTENLPRTT